MEKRYFIVSILLVVFAISCGGTQVKQDVVTDSSPIIEAQNKQLARASLDGFGYKSSKMPATQWDSWAKTTAPVVKEILNKIPDGYVLQVTGHADGSGPEQPEGNKPGNLKISKDRAYAVYSALKKAGIDSPKMTYKGVGSSELISGADDRAAEQRRVTFKVVPKE